MTTMQAPDIAPAMTTESKNWAALSHASALVMFLGVPSVLGPLLVWLVKRDDPFVDDQGKEALNFNISFLIYGIVSAVLVVALVGLILLPVVFVTWLAFVIVASLRAANGERYRYPFTLRFIA
jgi:uncharacterized Tic20 family protein